MTGRCDGCAKFTNTLKYEYYCSDKCMIDTEEKERAAMTDDSNCHCQTCTAMNEPLTLEGDIRYLKAHIESKDRQLADANLNIGIYREAWADAERAAARLEEKNVRLHDRNVELTDTVLRSREEIRLLREEIAQLRKEKEILIGDRTSLVEEANELYEKLGRILGIVNEVVE